MDLVATLESAKINHQSIGVVGLGISGLATAKVLALLGHSVIAVDKLSESDVISRGAGDRVISLKKLGVKLHFGVDGESAAQLFSNAGLCVLSPGISLESSIVGAICRRKIPLCNELELAVDLIGVPTVVVTGSNGKSTTVSLIHEMLKSSGMDSRLCGNVGIPVISLLESKEDKILGPLVIEASSYQLETCYHLHPNVAVWLNLSDNHLERHGTIDRYLEVKSKVFACQESQDFAVVNCDDSRLGQVLRSIRGKVCAFGRNETELKKITPRFALISYLPASNRDEIRIELGDGKFIFDLTKYPLLGIHNRYDAAAALLAALSLNASPEACQQVLTSFTGLSHRYESVAEVNGVLFINDSKSTTVASSCAAISSTLEAYPNRKLHLLLGGMVKAGSWDPFLKLAKSFVTINNPIACFGGDGQLIKNHCDTANIPAKLTSKLSDAFLDIVSRATSGDIVLLSPGCASFDEFQNFEKRGEAFVWLVREHGGDIKSGLRTKQESGGVPPLFTKEHSSI